MRRAKAIQLCGTGSGVGKSVIAAGFCRIFLQDGFRVCPFKAQNMALNSFVTKEKGEIGRAQAVQAAACRIEPDVDMNPVLIKPTSDIGAQVIIRGRPYGNMKAKEYIKHKKNFRKIVRKSFTRLSREYDVVVIEGAGSPAEVNLKQHDLVNMKMAAYAKAPVILVGDIDKGGVFAWLIGTLELLAKKERKIVKGFIINKFRGDKKLLKGGIDFLEKKTGIPVLGVIPYYRNIRIPEEDSAQLEIRKQKIVNTKINIAVIGLPHISNFTDFDGLENEPDVNLCYVRDANKLDGPDIIIIPGTKNTISDLKYLKKSGLAKRIKSSISNCRSLILVGICGGYQMLGEKICDRHKIESNEEEISGLGLLPIVTNLGREKVLNQVKGTEIATGLEVRGYEIHHGRTQNFRPVFKIPNRLDGGISKDGRVWGTYIHGVFDEDNFRRHFLNRIRLKKGWRPLKKTAAFNSDNEFDRLSNLLRKNINIGQLYKILGI